MKKSGIYLIINLINNKIYIGSSCDLECRFRTHRRDLKDGKHRNIHLQRSYDKYGSSNFWFAVIEYVEEKELLKLEQTYLEILSPDFNIAKFVSAPMKGRFHSKKTLEKLKGRVVWNKGLPRTEEVKNKISNTKKGVSWSAKQRRAVEEYYKHNYSKLKGRPLSKEMREMAIENGKSKRQKIICIQTNEEFESQIDAAKKLKIGQGHISEVLNGKRPSVKGYTFKKV